MGEADGRGGGADAGIRHRRGPLRLDRSTASLSARGAHSGDRFSVMGILARRTHVR